jgi:hypothetical protein
VRSMASKPTLPARGQGTARPLSKTNLNIRAPVNAKKMLLGGQPKSSPSDTLALGKMEVFPGKAAGCNCSSSTHQAGGTSETPKLDKIARQRKKASDVCTEDAEKAVRNAHTMGTLSKVALIELKAFLKSRGLPVGGKKAEVLERVENHLAQP